MGAGSAIADVVGRERELDELRRLVTDDPLPSALLLEGEAGIGKTTLWRATLELARRHGLRTLACRPAAAETHLSFAGLADLLAPAADEVLDELPKPQRRALRVALLLEEPDGPPPDVRSIATAFIGALHLIAQRGPVFLAVDDVQWLDEASAGVLRYAIKRIEDVPIRLLVARRGDGLAEPPLGLALALPDSAWRRVTVGPLSSGALHELIQRRLGVSFSRPMMRRLHHVAAGNPFYGLELARALGRGDAQPQADQPLPVPETLAGLVDQRLGSLPPTVNRLLALVALTSDARAEMIHGVIESDDLRGALDDAIAQGIVEISDGRVNFTHPLLASGVQARLGPEERRSLHARLSDTVNDSEEQALHLALATVEPDEAIAAVIERAAGLAHARGAREQAARLAEHAARLTPADDVDECGRRLIRAAEWHSTAGDLVHARTLLERQVAMSRPGALRGQALSLLSWVNLGDCNLTDAVRLARQALDEADDDDSLRALTLLRLGIVESIRGDLHVALDHVRSAIRVTEAGDDVALLAAALAYVGYLEVLRGHGIAPEARRAVELERSVTDFMGQFTASMTLGQVLMYSGALDEARDVLEETLTRAVVAGDEEARAALLFHLGDLERRAGRWERAMPLAREASSLYRESGNDQEYYSSLCPLELLEAGLGSLDEAQSLATEGLEAALRMGDETFAIHHRGILGFIELSRGNAAEACEWLRPAADALVRREVREVSIYPVFQNEIDALVATGELAQAERRVELLEAYASETGRSWTRVIAGRGRGLLLAATGDLDAARAALEAALHAEGGTGEPLERARTLLALGVVERRAKRKRPSREALDGARAIFAGLPAPVWVRRVDAELDRLGLRVGEDALTETEARVAALAAAGRTNPEIAAEVFISRKTVEATLSRVYRKLGVRSRVELARALPPSEQ